MQRHQLFSTFFILFALSLVLGLLFSWHYWRQQAAIEYARLHQHNVVAVEVGQVQRENWLPEIFSIGSVIAVQGVDVSAQIEGMVSHIFFDSGQIIQAGHPLIQLNDDTYQADVNNALATFDLAKLKYERSQRLLKFNAVAVSVVDQSKAEMEEALANLKKTQAELNQTLVKAPFDGRLGLRKVSIGQYVKAGDALVSLQQVDPVFVDFQLSEAYIGAVKAGYLIKLQNAAYPEKTFTGKVLAMNDVINQATRTLNVRAVVENPEGLLVPGMFAEVTVVIPTPQSVLTVPQMAVNFSPFGNTLFKVEGDQVKQLYVKLGEVRGDQMAVEGDLKAGDTIVTTGVFKLQDGTQIKIIDKKTDKPQPLPDKLPNKLQALKEREQAFSHPLNKASVVSPNDSHSNQTAILAVSAGTPGKS